MNNSNLFFLASLYQKSHFAHAASLSFLRQDSDNFSNSEMNVVCQKGSTNRICKMSGNYGSIEKLLFM